MRLWTYSTRSGRTSHGDLCGVCSNRAVDVFRCTLGMGRGGEDCAVVLSENVQPGCYVGCMILARFQGEFKVRTQERCSKLSDQFLDGITFAAETMSTEVTIEPVRAAGPVCTFMGQGCIVAVGILEAHERRHLYRVGCEAIVRAIAAVPDGCTEGGEEPICTLDPSDRIQLRGSFRIEDCRQPIDLLDIEYGVTLEERDFALDLVASLCRRSLCE